MSKRGRGVSFGLCGMSPFHAWRGTRLASWAALLSAVVILLPLLVIPSCWPGMGMGIVAPAEVARIVTGGQVPVVLVRDFDNDGLDELVIAEPYAGAYPYFEAGEIHVLPGPVRSRDLSQSSEDLLLRSQSAFKRFGSTLAAADLDGDGYRDLVIGSDTGLDRSASILVVNGTMRGIALLEDSAFLTLEGPPTFGQAITAMDYNQDGAEDLIVSCPVRSEVYVILGPRSGHLTLPDDADVVLTGGAGALGWTMSAGRFGVDGEMQLALAEPIREAVFLVPPRLLGRHDVTQVATAEIRSSDPGDNIIGCEGVSAGGLVEDRLIVRSRRADSEQTGTVFILSPPMVGQLDLRTDTSLTLEPVHIGRTMSPALGFAPSGPVFALGFPDQTQLPASGLTGQLWMIPADLEGRYELSQLGAGQSWEVRAQDVGLSLWGVTVRFSALTRPGASDLMVAGSGAVVVYSW